MHSIKQCGSLKVLELKHECWVIPASGSWWSQLLDIMWDKLITREARRWVQTTFVPDYTSAATRCLFVALLQFGGNENISSTPDPNQDQRKLNWSSQGRNFNLNIYCLCTVSGNFHMKCTLGQIWKLFFLLILISKFDSKSSLNASTLEFCE